MKPLRLAVRLHSTYRKALKLVASFRPSQWFWIAAILVSGFISYYFDKTSQKSDSRTRETATAPEDASTFIPAGFVLVPIEVANYESLDSILGQFGVVDLFLPTDGNQTGQKRRAIKVASRLKILRAPLNPSHFAVLARESEASQLVGQTGPFVVIVQNPKNSGTGIVSTPETPELEGTARLKSSRIKVEALDDQDG